MFFLFFFVPYHLPFSPYLVCLTTIVKVLMFSKCITNIQEQRTKHISRNLIAHISYLQYLAVCLLVVCKTHRGQRWFSCLAGWYSQRTPAQWQRWFPLERTWTPHSPPAWSRAVNTVWERLSRGRPVSAVAVNMPTLFTWQSVRQTHTHTHTHTDTDWVMHRCLVSHTWRLYLWIVPKPPDIGDRSHLAWRENHCQIDFFIFHSDKRGGEVNRLQLTCAERERKEESWLVEPKEFNSVC